MRRGTEGETETKRETLKREDYKIINRSYDRADAEDQAARSKGGKARKGSADRRRIMFQRLKERRKEQWKFTVSDN